jgi:Protein of unknown function (DUF2804)
MTPLPIRGPRIRELDLPLPPGRMPRIRDGRMLKRWHYVGLFSAELMLCAGVARVGPIPQRWWAVALPDGSIRQRTTLGRGGVRVGGSRLSVGTGEVTIEIALESGRPVEVVSPNGGSYIWTRKQAGVPARGTVRLGEEWRALEAEAVIDESAGYHEHRTAWRWSAGVGRAEGGERVAWNLVTGVHDAPEQSERAVWVDGEPVEVPPVEFADDLSALGGLRFSEWSRREADTNLVLFRNSYVQPFGSFEGELPTGHRLAEGFGVMEAHDARW